MTAKKQGLHPRNLHQGRYDFEQLTTACPELAEFVHENKYGNQTIDFADFDAVKTLNFALLKHFYGIQHWDIPDGYLCPPIPGRVDYLHHIADFLAVQNEGEIPRGKTVRVLDIGIGANAIYPLVGHKSYGWHFVGTDIDLRAIKTVDAIIAANKLAKNAIESRLQGNPNHIFKGMFHEGEAFTISICNPPFHASQEEALASTRRKWKNLKIDDTAHTAPKRKGRKQEVRDQVHLNFGGKNNELCYPGGEIAFVEKMIAESAQFPQLCQFFSTLISKKTNLPKVYKLLKKVRAKTVKTIEMGQGQKQSRVVVWGF